MAMASLGEKSCCSALAVFCCSVGFLAQEEDPAAILVAAVQAIAIETNWMKSSVQSAKKKGKKLKKGEKKNRKDKRNGESNSREKVNGKIAPAAA